MFVPKSFTVLRGYTWKQFRTDAGAGLVVGLVALPLAMAFAIASGLPPSRGLYTAIVAGFLISALGGSRVQIGGPTGAFVVIVGGIAARFGYDGLVIATFMAGFLLIAMALARFGQLVKFIPYPVITGFTSGIAVIIFSGQMRDFFGLRMTSVPIGFVDKWIAYGRAFSTVNGDAAILAVAAVLLIFFWPTSWHRVPAPVAAVVLVTAIAAAFHLPVETIGSRFGGIPPGLPAPHLPHVTLAQARQLFPSALTVAALGAIESLLSAVVADGMIGGNHRSDQELLAQGIANIASPIFGGIPATGAIARTATNIKNGGRTPVAGMVHAAVLLAILLVAGRWAALIPLAALSAVLVVVSYHMSEWHSFRYLLSGPLGDKIVLIATFLLTVFVDLVVGVVVGMVLSSFLFMKSMADLTEVTSHAGDGVRRQRAPEGVEIFSISGAFFFAAVHKLMEIDRILVRAPKALVLDMSDVPHMDASGLRVLDSIRRECGARGIRFMLAGLRPDPAAVLERAGRVPVFGARNLKSDLDAALADL